MSTTAQILANHLNSKKSTGPRTAEGKAAVSQNAVKHALFAAEAVITGENPADYELYCDQMLAELAPVGAVESMLTERFVSLSRQLKRAERMQNQVIEDMIEREVTNPSARHHRENYCYNSGIRPGDPRFNLDRLPLGRIATSDWSNCRVLDRLLMYERRIENSMTKMMKELKRHEIMRRIEHEDAGEQHLHTQTIPSTPLRTGPKASGFEAATHQQYEPSPSLRVEAATESTEKKGDLKKQTQFAPGKYDAKSYLEGYYENKPAGRIEENKAKQSQIQPSAPTKGAGKREKSLAAATG